MHNKMKMVEKYLGNLPDKDRMVLERLRKLIEAMSPDIEENMVYGVPGFRYKSKSLAAYAAFKEHYGFYPMSPKVIEDHKAELEDFITSKGAIKFISDKQLSPELIEKLVKARMKEIDSI